MSAKKVFFGSGVPDGSATVATAVRRALWPRASALTLGALGALGSIASGSALAADSPAAPSTDSREPLSEVVVTGIRESLESAQAIKQNSEQIVDSVSAQDIGALPDRSVSEALQRIPGVTLQRTDNNRDPARLSSEGGAVFIRGLSWVRSELNGRDIFSANNGRSLSFEDVSADLLSGIDVYKSPSADLIEGGIGGTVNLRTRMPFDTHKRIVAFSADYNYADLLKHGFLSGNGLFSDQWDTGIGRMGALISGSIGNVGNRTDSIQTGRFVSETLTAPAGNAPAGSTVDIPNSMGWRRVDWQQRRTVLSGAFQWEPTDKWLVTLQAFQSKDNPHDLEYAEGDYGSYLSSQAGISQIHFNSSGIAVSGTVPITPQLDTRYETQHHSTDDFSLGVKFAPTDRLHFSGDVQYVKSHADLTSLTAFTQVGDANGNPIANTNLNFDLSGNNPYMQLTQSPNVMTNPNNTWWAAAMDHLEDNDAHGWAERLDGDFKFEDNAWLDAFRFGVRATDKDSITRETGWNWSLLSRQYGGSSAPVFLSSTPSYASSLIPYTDFFRGNVNLPGVGYFPSYQLVRNGTAYAYSLLKGTETAGWGWTPLTTDWTKAIPGGDNLNSGINEQMEKTYAGYLLLRFAHKDTPLGKMDGSIGVRVVRTQEHTGPAVVAINGLQNALSVTDCVNANGAAACQFLINATNFTNGATTQGIQFPDNNYTDVLPTFNLRFLLTDDLQLRFALSKAMVRPSFSQMTGFTSLGFGLLGNSGYQPALVNSVTGTGGNPELKPTRAKQADTSLEWYFAPTGSLTFAAFYKDIKDYVFQGVDTESFTSNGVTEKFQVTRYINGASGKVKGFELGYQQFYDFLPGLLRGIGFQGNLTFVDSNGGRNAAVNLLDTPEATGAADQTLPLEGMSRWSYNAALMYEAHGVSARAAWNWRERYLLTTSAANINAPVWSENYGQLDSEVFYNITANVKLGVQGTNLLNSRTFLDVGGAVLAPRYQWTDTDRRYALAIRAQF
ncbi:MAG: TonB-dependent receptor [Gammaproteobacteria bacterium]|nr:TonB-dependent receptor [Gammaproteobacteria bacterium]